MKRLGGLALLLTAGTACSGLKEEAWWVDQLQPSSPCYEVDLVDGLDERSTTEVHALFRCVNKLGHLDPLVHVDAALDVETRAGTPVGVEAAALVNHMAEADLDPLAIAGVLLDALTAEDRPVDELLDLTLELGWGDRANRVRTGVVALDDPQATAGGVVLPLAPVLPVAAKALIADPLDPAGFAGDVLVDPETERWLRTLISALESDDPRVAEPTGDLLVHLGQGLQAASGPDSDSVRDLVDFFVVRANPVVDEISPAVDVMLSDPVVRQGMVPAIDDLVASGDLARLPADVVWLASVDVDGSPLSPGELSALHRFVRVLADTNRPVSCGLFLIPLFSSDNLAVDVLKVIADLEPGTVQDAAGVISAISGEFVDDIVELACDITPQTMEDLRAVEAISQPEAESLLAGFVSVLHVLENGSDDHIPAAADLAEALYRAGGVEPLEAVVLDLGTEPVVDDVVALVPVLLDPTGHGLSGGEGVPPIDLRDVIELTRWSFAVDPDTGLTGFQRVRPLMVPVLERDETWVALGNLADLLADDRTQTSQALALLPRIVALDEDLVLLRQLGPLLGDPELSGPFLRLLETNQLVDALLAEPAPGGPDVPIVFWGRLVITGTLEDVLRMIDTVVNGL